MTPLSRADPVLRFVRSRQRFVRWSQAPRHGGSGLAPDLLSINYFRVVRLVVSTLASLVRPASPAASCAIAQMFRERLCLQSRQSLATTLQRPRDEELPLCPATKTTSHSQC